ncbi:YceI family protein [Arenimonas oryziterrae]|uniref:Lipid/polyisoprenoid-binding YceI-like domain-containing protein n=1 Tax=Arenimonas oryziterrae DSM 21050 = YC6267 TaxID=1121015 RepID=A0A091BIQ8_9GAMM|nr:YceI family protein [Arenimonas oryziterrae]KFN44225.1 hypothetical protein N789_07345 [Arenimonas oryziterrae DSM 21050 = YC6267]
MNCARALALGLSGIALSFVSAVSAQDAAPPPEPAPVQEPVIVIDPARAQASFEVHLRLPMRAHGRFTQVNGELRGSAARGWRVLVQVDGRSLKFDGSAWMARMTRSEEFLAIDRYPEIRFHSQVFTDTVLRRGGVVLGELQLRGRRREVAFDLLPSTCARPGQDCDIQVRGRVSRHDFGMNAYRMTVRDQVDFDFRVRLLDGKTP